MRHVYRFAGPLMGVAVRAMPGFMTTTTRIGRAMLQRAREPHPPAVMEAAEINRLGERGGEEG
jgi:hypothetical protein